MKGDADTRMRAYLMMRICYRVSCKSMMAIGFTASIQERLSARASLQPQCCVEPLQRMEPGSISGSELVCGSACIMQCMRIRIKRAMHHNAHTCNFLPAPGSKSRHKASPNSGSAKDSAAKASTHARTSSSVIPLNTLPAAVLSPAFCLFVELLS